MANIKISLQLARNKPARKSAKPAAARRAAPAKKRATAAGRVKKRVAKKPAAAKKVATKAKPKTTVAIRPKPKTTVATRTKPKATVVKRAAASTKNSATFSSTSFKAMIVCKHDKLSLKNRTV